ncbi:MAG: GNAT family N-acetyltransferase [Betaproteobacteria bacterium]
MRDRSIFISGEKIDLCAPNSDDLEEWAGWFNDENITRYLQQGVYPNSAELQGIFLREETSRGRFIVMIRDKGGKLLGTISLSEIDHWRRSCQVSYVCPIKSTSARYAALEALARVAQHAFDALGMQVIWSGHVYPGLAKWVKKTEVLGFRTEGLLHDEFRFGNEASDSVRTYLNRDTYLDLLKYRNGVLWPGEVKVGRMLTEYGKHESLCERVLVSMEAIYSEHEKNLKKIELET